MLLRARLAVGTDPLTEHGLFEEYQRGIGTERLRMKARILRACEP